MSRQSTTWRRRIVDRLYIYESRAVTEDERAHWHFCRELVYRALDGWRDPWVAAHYYLYGLHPVKYQRALSDLAARQASELAIRSIHRVTASASSKLAA